MTTHVNKYLQLRDKLISSAYNNAKQRQKKCVNEKEDSMLIKKQSVDGKREIMLDPKKMMPPVPNVCKRNLDEGWIPKRRPSIQQMNDDKNAMANEILGMDLDIGTRQANQKFLERANGCAVQQLKNMYIRGPHPISAARRKFKGINREMIEVEKWRQILSDTIVETALWVQKMRDNCRKDHMVQGKPIYVVERLHDEGVGAFFQNSFPFTSRYGKSTYGSITQFPKYEGGSLLMKFKEQEDTSLRSVTLQRATSASKKRTRTPVQTSEEPTAPSSIEVTQPITTKKGSKKRCVPVVQESSCASVASVDKENAKINTTNEPIIAADAISVVQSEVKTPEKYVGKKALHPPLAPVKKAKGKDGEKLIPPLSPPPFAMEKQVEKDTETEEKAKRDTEKKKRSSRKRKKRGSAKNPVAEPAEPSWGSFDQDSNEEWKNSIIALSSGRADKCGRISDFVKIMPNNLHNRFIETAWSQSRKSELDSMLELGPKYKKDKDYAVTCVVKKNPEDACAFAAMLISSTQCANYIQQLFSEMPRCVSVAKIWIAPTCPMENILQIPHLENGKLTRYYQGAQLILVSCLSKDVILKARSILHPKEKPYELVLLPSSVAMFSRDIVVDVVGSKGDDFIPEDANRRRIENTHSKCLIITYIHVKPKIIGGLQVKQSRRVKKKRRSKPNAQTQKKETKQ